MEAKCTIRILSNRHAPPTVSIWNAARINDLGMKEKQEMKTIIDEMGIRSARAQMLKTPITNYDRLRSGSHQLYLWTMPHTLNPNTIIVKGLLRTGSKNLYIRTENNRYKQINPTCVLDFYVHESCQRTGLGRQIFEAMLDNENKQPHQLGYDRPSSKLMSFLAKHYCLSRYIPQINQFVVFNAYFDDDSTFSGDQTKKCKNFTSEEKKNQVSGRHLSYLEGSIRDKGLLDQQRRDRAEDLPTKYSDIPVIEDMSTDPATHGLSKCSIGKDLSSFTNSQSEDRRDIENKNQNLEGRLSRNQMLLTSSDGQNCSQSTTEGNSLLLSVENSKNSDRAKLFQRQAESNLYDHHSAVASCKKLQHMSKHLESNIFGPTKKITLAFLPKENEEISMAGKTDPKPLVYAGKNLNRTPMTPRTCYHTHLSGTGVAAALGFSNRVFNR